MTRHFLTRAFIPVLLGVVCLLSPVCARSQTPYPAAYGFCEVGKTQIVTSAIPSTTYAQGSFPACTVTVYNHSTVTPSTLFSDSSGTPLGNPFTASSTSGLYQFFAAQGDYDIKLSGAGIPTPLTISGIALSNLSASPTLVNATLSGTTTNAGTISGGTMNPATLATSANMTATNANATVGTAMNAFGTSICSGYTVSGPPVTAWPSDVTIAKGISINTSDCVVGSGINDANQGPAMEAQATWQATQSIWEAAINDERAFNSEIVSISRSADVVTAVTYTNPLPGYLIGATVSVTGVGDSSFDGSFTVTSASSSGNTVTWAQTAANASSTGGSLENLTAQAQWANAVEISLAAVGIPNVNKAFADSSFTSQSMSFTYSGTWTLSGGVAHQYQTTTNGAAVNFTFYGSSFYLATACANSVTSTYTVDVDGAPIAASPFSTTGNWTSPNGAIYGLCGVRVSGLLPGPHSATLTASTGTNASNPVYFTWAGVPGGAQDQTGTPLTASAIVSPLVYVLNIPISTQTNFQTNGGSLQATQDMNSQLAEIVNELNSDGMEITLVPMSPAYNPDAAPSQVQSDSTHPNNLGHQIIANQIVAAMTAVALPGDRGGAQLLSNLNACTIESGLFVGGCPFVRGGLNFNRGDIGAGQSATGGNLWLGLDGKVVLSRSAGTVSLAGANATEFAAPSLAIGGGTALTTSNQTGTGSIVLATSPSVASPTLTGTTTAATLNATTLEQGGIKPVQTGTVTFVASATAAITVAFTSATTYACTATDPSHNYTWTFVNSSSTSSTITSGTSNSDTWTYACMGN